MIFKLIFIILSIQLINTSIINDNLQVTNYNESFNKFDNVIYTINNGKKKMIDTQILIFKSSTYFKRNNKRIQQLQCLESIPSNEKLCPKYKGSFAKCINKNYRKHFSSLFDCKLSKQTVTNKNIQFHVNLISCKGETTKNPYEYNLPSQCILRYRLYKNDNFNIEDDMNGENNEKDNSKIGWINLLIFILIIIGCFIYYRIRTIV